ncbi:hypothetical protein KTD13_20945 [Burkholderia multivorans]|uniref:hypothetical protein n=1 Tax=Burkholderia multivorans TaxID=87883 RepID=UPI001C21AE6A|nr:hypothetical protein [Burkholderia multivorans]MBU9262818.1 hypothetical protein [Burkholderia multivorans]
MISYKKFVWMALVLVVFFSGLSVRKIQPNVSGDGIEYTLMAQAFLTHGTPNITQDDYEKVRAYSGDARTNVPEVAGIFPLTASPPFFRDIDGRYYSYHFWLYSLFVAPFLFLVKLFGAATPWAFVATNLTFSIVASCVICAWRGISREKRLLLLTLYWSAGTIPYIGWTHPEVFSASLLVVAIVMVLSRRYVTGAVAAAMVAQQNPPALFLVAIFLIIDFFSNCKKTGAIVPSVRKTIEWVACVALAFLSIGFCYIHFRTGNLIANSGFTRVELISIERLWSFYFDLNQGIIVLLWPLLIIVPVMVAYGVMVKKLKMEDFIVAIALVCTSIVMAIPSVSATNFNSGASFVLRYAYWASIPLLFAVMLLYVEDNRSRGLVYIAVAFFSAMNLSYYKGEGGVWLYYTPVAEKVMARFPGMYNPVPEIFAERGLHFDGALNEQSVYYYVWRGNVRKVLLHERYGDIARFKCFNGDAASRYVDSISRVEQGWAYFNLKSGCTTLYNGPGTYKVQPAIDVGNTLYFRKGGNGGIYLDTGWSRPEAWGIWSGANEASIVLSLKRDDVSELSLVVSALVTPSRPEQLVDVSINGVSAGSVSLRDPYSNKLNIRIPQQALSGMRNLKMLKLSFKFHDAVSPKTLGINEDERKLTMGLISLTIK